MGADRPQAGKPDTQIPTPIPLLLIAAAVLLSAIALFFPKMDFNGEDKVPELSPQDEAKLQKRLKEIDEAEQYALIANDDGWYSCLHSSRTTYYLLAGEVWKYGVTSKGEFGRYAGKFLRNNKVSYVTEFRGNIAECLKMEQIKLFNYPFLPENLARPPEERLPRPPFNPIMR
ncbi:MAG: hypothetical protein IPJ82_09865 [Lewinellaceae bacterium]|nr:hypothetical protein [Lewinellaceae bacterium]